MYVMYEPNPVRTGAIDCTVRAISKALDVSWEKAYTLLSVNGFLMGNAMVADEIWSSILRQHGFKRRLVPDTCPDCYTVADFAKDHPKGTYVIKSDEHVATVVDGVLYDSWKSDKKIPIYYWTNNEEDEN